MRFDEVQRSKRAARHRRGCSLPCRLIERHENIAGHGLHFGCGKDQAGTARLHKVQGVLTVMEYDPNYADYPELLECQYDFVVANYVLNVLPPRERKQAIKQIRTCMKKNGVAYITVRSINDSSIKGKPEFDGVRTSIGTFQRGYTVKELENELRRYFKCVELVPIPRAPKRLIMMKVTGKKWWKR